MELASTGEPWTVAVPWLAALEALERARRDRCGLDGEADPWALAMADHEVHRARGHVRRLAAALDLSHGV